MPADVIRALAVFDGGFVLRADRYGNVEFGVQNEDGTHSTLTVSRGDALYAAETFLAFVRTLPDRIEEETEEPSLPVKERPEGPCVKCHGAKIDVAEDNPLMRRCQTCGEVWRVPAPPDRPVEAPVS